MIIDWHSHIYTPEEAVADRRVTVSHLPRDDCASS
jgi:hypothetical protein